MNRAWSESMNQLATFLWNGTHPTTTTRRSSVPFRMFSAAWRPRWTVSAASSVLMVIVNSDSWRYNNNERLTVATSRASTEELWGVAWIWPCGCQMGMAYLTWRRRMSRIEATGVALWVWMRGEEKWSRIKNRCDIAAIFKRWSILRHRNRNQSCFHRAP